MGGLWAGEHTVEGAGGAVVREGFGRAWLFLSPPPASVFQPGRERGETPSGCCKSNVSSWRAA